MKFREFFNLTEVGTSTANIAGFSRICMPMNRRLWPNDYSGKKKKPYRVPQVDEMSLPDHAKQVSGGCRWHNPANHKNHFSLFSGMQGLKKATEEGDKIIDRFVNDWDRWSNKHKKLGASDSASRDAFMNKLKSEIDASDAYSSVDDLLKHVDKWDTTIVDNFKKEAERAFSDIADKASSGQNETRRHGCQCPFQCRCLKCLRKD